MSISSYTPLRLASVSSGTEIKSIREGRANLKDGFASVEGGELWLHNVHISPYEKGTIYNKDPLRPRKLLVHKTEIRRLLEKTREKGFTLVPLKIYLKEGKRAKVELPWQRASSSMTNATVPPNATPRVK